MLSQRINKVKTPRKRNRSEPMASDGKAYNITSVIKAEKSSENYYNLVEQD